MRSRLKHRLSRGLDYLAGLLGRKRRARIPSHPRARPDAGTAELERVLGYRFEQPSYLARALTHPSAAGPGGGIEYERLEFLGDAVLDLAVADLLMQRFPDAREGALSKFRASVVNGRTLALKAQSLGIGKSLRLGKGEEKSGGREKTSILAAALEAVIGAIYVDGGIASVHRVVAALFGDDLGGTVGERDYKTELQEVAHRRFRTQPIYELVSERGPDHAKQFTTRIRIAGRELGTGNGASKKQSEQAAAKAALDRIEQDLRERH